MPLQPRQTYLDHNATTPLAEEVRRAMIDCLTSTYGNPSSVHTAGRAARAALEHARSQVAAVLSCRPGQVIFTSGGTEADNTAIRGVFSAAGTGHIVTSAMEHEAILNACHRVEQMGGEVTYLQSDPHGRIRLEDVESAIRPDTLLVSIMHANNETGVIQPVREIAELAHSRGIAFHTDAVQSFGKIPVKVDEIGCDFLSLSAHKINGPKGVGALYWRGEKLFWPILCGGEQEMGMRPGTEGLHQIVGLGAAAELAESRSQLQWARLAGLRKQMIEGIRKIHPRAVINQAASDNQQLPGTVSATFPGRRALELLAGMDCFDVYVSMGAACTASRIMPSHVLKSMGLSDQQAMSTIRISMGSTTAAQDVEFFLLALQEVLHGRPEGLSFIEAEELTPQRLSAGQSFVIDMRPPYKRQKQVPCHVVWQADELEANFKNIPQDKELILICATGVSSYKAGYRLAKAGHPRVRVLYGGVSAWQQNLQRQEVSKQLAR